MTQSTPHSPASPQHVGQVLRQWRKRRGLSQLQLSQQAGVSTRHLSFVENGRSEPSRQMLLRLGRVLQLPPREGNELFGLCGLSAPMRETPLDAPEMREMMRALKLLLKQHEPFPAVAVDGTWDIVMCNGAFGALRAALGAAAPTPFTLWQERQNLLEPFFDPEALRRCVSNWETAGRALLERLVREQAHVPRLRPLLRRLLAHDGVAELLEAVDPAAGSPFVVPLELALGEQRLALLSTITTLGTPRDLTLAELHVESFHPLDDNTEAFFRRVKTAPT